MVLLCCTKIAFGAQIHEAAGAGDVEMVKALLRVDPGLANNKDTSQMDITPLHMAAFKGSKQVAELLLLKKADINAKARDGSTPLHLAALGGHKDIAELLLANTADADTKKHYINTKNEEGATALFFAAQNGHKDVVELLLANKAELNAKMIKGAMPLHVAAGQGHKQVVVLLLDRGAEIDALSDAGWTPLKYADSNNHSAIVELLLSRGASGKMSTITGGVVSTFDKGVESQARAVAGTILMGPGGKLKKRYQFTGEYVTHDSATDHNLKLTSGMTMSEFEAAAKGAGVNYTRLADDSAKVGEDKFYFKEGKLNEIESVETRPKLR